LKLGGRNRLKVQILDFLKDWKLDLEG
jgi:hypothetical protein